MQLRVDYHYEAYDRPEVKQIRIPQQEWMNGAPPLGANVQAVTEGVVRWFDLKTGNGMIARNDGEEDVFFNFTAIPGEGYRTLQAGTPVRFELVESRFGFTARNIHKTAYI